MNKEIKDFFVRNGAEKIKNRLHLDIGDDYELALHNNYISIIDIETGEEINVLNPTLDMVKALIYGLTGKQLD